MKVLLVSYDAPPVTSPRSIRVARVARALLEAGDAVQILTVDVGGDDAWLAGQVEGADIVRTRPGPLEARSLRRQAAGTSGGGGGGGRRRRRDVLRQAVQIPDERAEWIALALDPRLPLQTPDVVISFFPRFSAVVAGHRLARRLGAAHVIDYGDPWSIRHAYELPRWRQRIDQALEAHILGRAAGVVLSAEPQRAHLQEHFRRLPPIAIHTNGYHPDDYGPPPEGPRTALRYLGSLYSPRVTFDGLGPALAVSERWDRLETYGHCSPAVRAALPDWLAPHDPVTFATSLELMQGAAALFLMGNKAGLQIPSKVFNYVGAGRPVLAMVESPDDPMTRLGLGDQVVFTGPSADEATAALRQVAERADQTFTPPAHASWEHIGERYRASLTLWK